MAIRRLKTIVLIFFCSSFLFSSPLFSYGSEPDITPQIHTSDSDLPDKVYAFLSPNDILTFTNIYLEKYYRYFIWIEIVTPHNCTIQITLWDPEGMQYNLFENKLTYELESSRYYDIPFGTALTGNYTLEFQVVVTENVNIYIRMEKGGKCLYDKIAMEEYDEILFYRVSRFSNGMNISHKVDFKTDYMYKFYIERVSPISVFYSNQISVVFFIEDPEDLEYGIYSNETLTPINEIKIFKFGTASEGEYTFSIMIQSEVEYVNIGYAVIELYKISQGVDPNQSSPNNSTHPRRSIFSIPEEWTIGIVIFFGFMITGLVVVVAKKRSKNIARFKERI